MKDFKVNGGLGKGAFAAVTKVTRRSDGKTYALKRVNISKMKSQEISDTLNEVRATAGLFSTSCSNRSISPRDMPHPFHHLTCNLSLLYLNLNNIKNNINATKPPTTHRSASFPPSDTHTLLASLKHSWTALTLNCA